MSEGSQASGGQEVQAETLLKEEMKVNLWEAFNMATKT